MTPTTLLLGAPGPNSGRSRTYCASVLMVQCVCPAQVESTSPGFFDTPAPPVWPECRHRTCAAAGTWAGLRDLETPLRETTPPLPDGAHHQAQFVGDLVVS